MTQLSDTQAQTSNIFGYKWGRRETYDTGESMTADTRRWYLEKYFGGDEAQIDALFGNGDKVFLDAGCGSGYSAFLLFDKQLTGAQRYIGVDVSSAVAVGKERAAERGVDASFVQADLATLPMADACVDIVFSEGVLHHTDDPAVSLNSLARIVKPGGSVLFYVYRKKAPIREFTDDHIRAQISHLDPDAAWEKLMPLTKLGKQLGDLNITLDIPEDVDVIGLEKGQIDLQRLFYYTIFKCFYRPDMDMQEMNHINFDWYMPLNCHRMTVDEVKQMCRDSGLTTQRMHEDGSGITVVATKD